MNQIFNDNVTTETVEVVTPAAPIMHYDGYIDPRECHAAIERGKKWAKEIDTNIIADFERTIAYCEKHGENNPDRMVHVSTFKIIDGTVYMTYYANTGTEHEDPRYQEARIAYCSLDDPSDMRIVRVQKVGETLSGKTIDCVYDTILLYKGGDELYILWTASADGEYYRFYRTFGISKKTMGDIGVNRFQVGNVTNDFSMSGIKSALAYNDLPIKKTFADIGIMQKLSTRIENGETYYYTGAYSGYFNCIIKSRDFVTWEYVSAPDFVNYSHWENAVYVVDDICYYFVRQDECKQGMLTCYDLNTGKWRTPCLVRDAQSRSDFLYSQGELYLVHAPKDRSGFGVIKVNRHDFKHSEVLAVVEVPCEGAKESLFYPYTEIYGEEVYISYTVDRKHIRLSKFHIDEK